MRALAAAVFFVASSALAPGNAALWKRINKLESDQQLKAALPLVEQALSDAQKSGDAMEQAHALTERTKLEMGLGAAETALQHLRAATWPTATVPRTVLDLYYAQALTNYRSQYAYEILRREEQGPREKVELKAWTAQQIREEIDATYLDAWKRREALGTTSIEEVARFVEVNNYPKGVRDTVRDAVSYLWAQNLGISYSWSASESAAVYSLDVAKLLSGAGATLDDPAAHPLAKISTVLVDLESRHRSQHRVAAALEARIELDVALHQHLDHEDARSAIRDDLSQHIEAAKSDPWSAEGTAQLAMLYQSVNEAKTAHELARAGATAFPGSIGSKHCEAIVKSIEAPELSMQLMASDGPRQRSLMLMHRNLPRAYFRAYRFDLERFLRESRDYNRIPNESEIVAEMAKQSPLASWTVELPPTPDFQSHRTFVTPPLGQKGGYLVVVSAEPSFARSGNGMFGSSFVISDLMLRSRQGPDGLDVEALAAGSGAPVKDAQVSLYRYDYRTGHQQVASARSDADGRVHFAPKDSASYFLVAKHGDDLALDSSDFWLGGQSSAEDRSERALIFTDRQIYRPTQRIQWKLVAFTPEGGDRFTPRQHGQVTIFLTDANGQNVESKNVTTDDFGTASGEFEVPTGRLLGQWSLRANDAYASVRVEEYKRPTFEVTVDAPKEALRLNRPASFVGHARYYFGLPVSSGKVAWRVYREPVFPDFGWWFRPPGGQRQLIAGGEAKVGGDGEFTVTFTPKGDEHAISELSYAFSLSADVTDEGGETRSGDRRFQLGTVAVRASIDPSEEFFREGEAPRFDVKREDLDGTPRAGSATWWVDALVPPASARLPSDLPVEKNPMQKPGYQTDGDKLRPRWEESYEPAEDLHGWADGREVARGELRHGQDGAAQVQLSALPAGAYRLHYRTTDPFGATYETEREWLVTGERLQSPLAAVLLTQQETVHVGETEHLLATSGIGGQPFELILLRNDQVLQRRWMKGGEGAVVDVPITPELRGGFTAMLLLVRDHQSVELSQHVSVPWDDKELKLSFSTFRDRFQPGEHERWTVQVARPDGKPVGAGAAQVLAFMYDRSLDLFGKYTPPAVTSIYPSHFGSWSVRNTLGSEFAGSLTNGEWVRLPEPPELRGDQLKEISPYGIGGPGMRMRRFAMKAEAAPGAPPPPAPQALADKDSTPARGMIAGKVAEPATGSAAPTPAVQPRANFAETGFWQPALLTNADGSVKIEFTAPDSVTGWNVWVSALTRNLEGGQLHKTATSTKPLMVRPYLPRFLRVGDTADVKVEVNNASEGALAGDVRLEVIDPSTQQVISDAFGLSAASQHFSIAPGKGASVSFSVRTPERVGLIAFRATATAPGLSDGELRPIPVLPSRVTLTQSRFVTLHDADQRTLSFPDLAKSDDPTRHNDQLVVTLDAQLFYSMLDALPYLVNYPYECTEQTLNRFVSAGILSSLFDRYPAIAKVAKELSKRTTPLETFDSIDPNRKLALEETPWVVESKGGEGDSIDVLDPRIAKANRESALAKLRKAQTSSGGFPWWSGGPPSPYMTAYLMYGFAKAAQFQVDVPKDMVQRGWAYLAEHYRQTYGKAIAQDRDWEFLTFLNFVASSYPDESWTNSAFTMKEREQMLAVSLKHWREHSPYLKSMLAITLVKMGKPDQAKKVFASVMDSSTTTRDEGTFWQPEDRSWLWYRDTIETQAFALQALMTVDPKDARQEGLVQWLMLHKKLNHWKSTRATAEALYSVALYLEKQNELAIPEQISVVLPQGTKTFDFSPEHYTGKKQQVVIPGPEVTPAHANITVKKPTKGLAFASASWTFSTEKPVSEASGDLFSVTRRYFRRVRQGEKMVLEPLEQGAKLSPGDELEVHLSLRARHEAEYVHLRDPRGAGFEPEELISGYRWDLGMPYYEEVRDSGTNFFFETLPVGEYTFHYRVRVAAGGSYLVGPATVQSMYAPEFSAYSTSTRIEVAP